MRLILLKHDLEAVELYKKAKESKKPFGVLNLDLTVSGGMGGKENIQKLLEINPKIFQKETKEK